MYFSNLLFVGISNFCMIILAAADLMRYISKIFIYESGLYSMRFARGFTLIEVMLVIAVITVLAGIMIPNFVHARAEAHLRACESNMKTMATALEMMAAVEGSYMPGGAAGFRTWHTKIMNYMKSMPSCPSCGEHYRMEFSPNYNACTIYCGAGKANHAICGLEAGYAQYSSYCGLVKEPEE